MPKGKSSISKAQTYEEIGEFWDNHDVTEFWDQTEEAAFDINIKDSIVYYKVEGTLSDRIQTYAKGKGISTNALIKSWLEEKLKEVKS